MPRRRVDLPELRSLLPEPGQPVSLYDPPALTVAHEGLTLASGDTLMLRGSSFVGGSAFVGPFAQTMRVQLQGGTVLLRPFPETTATLTVTGSVTSEEDLAQRLRETMRASYPRWRPRS